MKYKVYELVEPSLLSKTERDGYDLKTENLIVLKELDGGFRNNLGYTYDSMESAKSEVVEFSKELKNKKLTILPIIDINWEGEIKE